MLTGEIDMNETTVTKGERFYTVATNGIVNTQAATAQGVADWLWAMKMKARWMLCPDQQQKEET